MCSADSNKIKSYFRIKSVRGNFEGFSTGDIRHIKGKRVYFRFLFFRQPKWSEIPGQIARVFSKTLMLIMRQGEQRV